MTPERKDKFLSVLNKRQGNITVVLENVMDPHNEAAVMRTCDSVGIQDIYIITNRTSRKREVGFRSGSGAKKWLTIHEFSDVNKCIQELRKTYKKILTTHLSSNAVSLYDINFTESIALVFGNEWLGVSEELVALSDGNFIIPQTGMIQSLNISVACAITIYEAYRQKESAGHYKQTSLPQEKQTELLMKWGFKDEDFIEQKEN